MGKRLSLTALRSVVRKHPRLFMGIAGAWLLVALLQFAYGGSKALPFARMGDSAVGGKDT